MSDFLGVEKALSDDLAYWRAERPDEWTMDRFIRKAKSLEEQNRQLAALVQQAYLEGERNIYPWDKSQTKQQLDKIGG